MAKFRTEVLTLEESSYLVSHWGQQVDQNAAECVDERAALANLIANLTLDTEENKTGLLTRLHGRVISKRTQGLRHSKVKEDKDIDKMIEMEKQLKVLNEIVYTRNQSIQTIHMLAPKCATYNGRLTFANPRFALIGKRPDIDNESRSKLD
ncbi:hypothetical protein Tco_0097053 [Tanacetum coccineum]